MAGINLSRIIVIKMCGEDLYCFLPFTTLAGGEVAAGILVACVPTLAPVFHPERFRYRAVARRQRENSRQELLTARGRVEIFLQSAIQLYPIRNHLGLGGHRKGRVSFKLVKIQE